MELESSTSQNANQLVETVSKESDAEMDDLGPENSQSGSGSALALPEELSSEVRSMGVQVQLKTVKLKREKPAKKRSVRIQCSTAIKGTYLSIII